MSDRPLHDERERLIAERAAARERLGVLEGEDRRAGRALDAARAGLLDYLRECEERGRAPDPAEVERLEAPARAVAHRMASEVVTAADPETGIARVMGTDLYDPAVRAQLAGARARVENTEQALAAFERENWLGLLGEVAPDARERVDAWLDTAEAFAAAEQRLQALSRHVAGLAQRTGAFAISDLPGPPLSNEAARELSEVVHRGRRDPDAYLPLPRAVMQGAA